MINKGLERFLENAHCSDGSELVYKVDMDELTIKKHKGVYKSYCLAEATNCPYFIENEKGHSYCNNPIPEVKYEKPKYTTNTNDSSKPSSKRSRKNKQRKH